MYIFLNLAILVLVITVSYQNMKYICTCVYLYIHMYICMYICMYSTIITIYRQIKQKFHKSGTENASLLNTSIQTILEMLWYLRNIHYKNKYSHKHKHRWISDLNHIQKNASYVKHFLIKQCATINSIAILKTSLTFQHVCVLHIHT